jgi:hypothetical protein
MASVLLKASLASVEHKQQYCKHRAIPMAVHHYEMYSKKEQLTTVRLL